MPKCTRPACLQDGHITAARCTGSAAKWCCAHSHPVCGQWVKWRWTSPGLKPGCSPAHTWEALVREQCSDITNTAYCNVLVLLQSLLYMILGETFKSSFGVLEAACGMCQVVFSVFRLMKVFSVPLSILTCKEKSSPAKSFGEKYLWMKMF